MDGRLRREGMGGGRRGEGRDTGLGAEGGAGRGVKRDTGREARVDARRAAKGRAKRGLAALLSLFLLLPLCMCAGAEDEDLPQMEGVRITLDDAAITTQTDALNFTMVNDTGMEVTFGEVFRLEIKKNGKWKSAGKIGPVDAIGYQVDPGESLSHAFLVSQITRRPKPGRYRLGVPFMVLPAATPFPSFEEQLKAAGEKKPEARDLTSYIAYAEFEMTR